MFGGCLVWDEMFTGRLVGGRSVQAPAIKKAKNEFWDRWIKEIFPMLLTPPK
jgi:hypothetical protein